MWLYSLYHSSLATAGRGVAILTISQLIGYCRREEVSPWRGRCVRTSTGMVPGDTIIIPRNIIFVSIFHLIVHKKLYQHFDSKQQSCLLSFPKVH